MANSVLYSLMFLKKQKTSNQIPRLAKHIDECGHRLGEWISSGNRGVFDWAQRHVERHDLLVRLVEALDQWDADPVEKRWWTSKIVRGLRRGTTGYRRKKAVRLAAVICTLLVVVSLVLIVLPNCWFYGSFQGLMMPRFETKTFGILVCPFVGSSEGESHKGAEVQGTITRILNARFRELKIQDARAKIIASPHVGTVETHNDARKIGKKYGATLVIWGAVTIAGVIPEITIVNPGAEIGSVMGPETTLLRDSLCHVTLSDSRDIRLPALTDDPICVTAYVAGLAYKRQQKYKEALQCFLECLKTGSKDIHMASIYFELGNVYQQIGDYTQSIQNYDLVLAGDPSNAVAFVNRATSYGLSGDTGRAMEDYDVLLRNNPTNKCALWNRASFNFELGQYKSAIADFTAYANIDPLSSQVFLYRGCAYIKEKEYDRAVMDFTKALSMNSFLQEAYTYRAQCLLEKGEIASAAADYTKAINLDPKDADAYMRRGTCNARTGRHDLAVLDYDKALALNPQLVDAYHNRAVSREELGALREAIADYSAELALDGSLPRALYLRGDAYRRLGMYTNAVNDLTRLIELEPSNEVAYLCRADVYYTIGDKEKAKADYLILVALNPNGAPIYFINLGRLFLETKDFKKALENYNRALLLSPTNERALWGVRQSQRGL